MDDDIKFRVFVRVIHVNAQSVQAGRRKHSLNRLQLVRFAAYYREIRFVYYGIIIIVVAAVVVMDHGCCIANNFTNHGR